MDWVTLAGSLAAVFAVAGIVWFMGMGKSQRIADPEQAMALARDAHSGFCPVDALVDNEGAAALVAGEGGTVVLVRPHGAQIAARVFAKPPEMELSAGLLTIATGDRRFGDIVLRLGDEQAARWPALLERMRHG
ncbi:MAG: hypothetical protein HKN78_09455 [Sphingomonadaceae bacterium]|nr:hypothetical protein [Sphingomonadaceae bacterium]